MGEEGRRGRGGKGFGLREGSSNYNEGWGGPSKHQLGPDPHLGGPNILHGRWGKTTSNMQGPSWRQQKKQKKHLFVLVGPNSEANPQLFSPGVTKSGKPAPNLASPSPRTLSPPSAACYVVKVALYATNLKNNISVDVSDIFSFFSARGGGWEGNAFD